MSMSSCKTFEDMIARARERKIELEIQTKQKPVLGLDEHILVSAGNHMMGCVDLEVWVVIIAEGLSIGIKCDLFSLQPGGPQEGRMSGTDEWSNEGSCSCYAEDY